MPPPDTLARPESVEVAPGIFKTPGVCGGRACVDSFRIPVWLLEGYRQLGATDADLLRNYPSLTAEHLVHAAAYVVANRAEIEADIRENDEA
ncbi:MAG TPA: DUF433 domain-containing protein [Urbifossiella sp.]|nr:DUF433 domain-containing protein [Urbifossiella sp.]